ncbi:MAK10-like protein [Tanacetum coccineum]|uniref:MAK10-like protein n=1 Tax=Tanacetum coccineum TaxID=301880 RepID=A0ABQ5ISH7_9ASTR
MGDENPICTLGDYSKPSHEGYKNTIELPVGNNVDFLKLVDSLDLDGENRERTRMRLRPQPQALETTFEAQVRDYMAAHIERIERFENAIFKQHGGINSRMTEMFGLLKELMTSRTPEKVLIREEAKFPVTKNVNSISLTKGEEERSNKKEVIPNNTGKPTETEMEMPVKEAEMKNGAENRARNKSIKTLESEEAMEAPGSQPVAYYLKHKINEKLIKGLVDNNRFNNSLSGTRVRKKKGKTYKVFPRGPVYEAILKKKITRKEDIRGNFKIPSSHSYIYPLGITEDVLIEVAEHVYPVDFVILDIKENEKRPFILGTPFLTMANATIKFDKGTITLRSGKNKVSFHRIPDPSCMSDKGVKNDIEPIASTMTVNRLVLEWEERIRLHQEKEMKFDQWRSKNFKDKHPALTEVEEELKDKGEVT